MLPSPAVAAGDQLRDSLGNLAAVRVLAYDQRGAVIPGVTVSYLVTSLPAGASIDASGNVTALDSVRSVVIVAHVGDRQQTTPETLQVVAQPDSIAKAGTIDSLVALKPSSPMQVSITGLRKGTRTSVRAILVRYRITKVYPGTVDPALYVLESGLSSDPTRSVDTTDAGGTASRTLTAVTLSGVDSVEVQASANNLLGAALKGSPLRFVLPVKKGS